MFKENSVKMHLLEQLTIKDTFKQWRDKINAIVDDYDHVLSSDDNGTLIIGADNNKTTEVIFNTPVHFNDTVVFGDGIMKMDIQNGYITGTVEYADKLKYIRKINGTDFNGTEDITTKYWGTARKITISDSTKKHVGDFVNVNGSSNINLLLPETLDCDITGNAATVSKLQTKITINGSTFDGSSDIVTKTWGNTQTFQIVSYEDISHLTTDVDGSSNTTVKLYLPKVMQGDLTGNAETSSALKYPRLIDGVAFDGSKDIYHYGVCRTQSDTQIKEVKCDGFTLEPGATINVKFVYDNNAEGIKLNVNGTSLNGIPVYQKNNPADISAVKRDGIYTFIYDGLYYQLVGSSNFISNLSSSEDSNILKADLDGNAATATSLQEMRNIDGIDFDGTEDVMRYSVSATGGATATKLVTCKNFKLIPGATITVKFKNKNTAAAPKLNVNKTGVVPICRSGEQVGKNSLLGNTLYTFVYDGTNFEIISSSDMYLNSDTPDVIVSNESEKLVTPRNIWGQPFDGTTDVTGNITLCSGIKFTGVANNSETGGNIDFHYNNNSEYTTRIIEESSGTITIKGNVRANKIYNAVWNDYAELFPKGEETIAGDIIALDENSVEKEQYIKATNNSLYVVGVHSDSYGQLIGGENPPSGVDYEEYNMQKYIPVGLSGRVFVNFVGESKLGMPVVPSDIPGYGCLFNKLINTQEQIVGYIVFDENPKSKKKRKVKIKIK